jgi:hypothetical protein
MYNFFCDHEAEGVAGSSRVIFLMYDFFCNHVIIVSLEPGGATSDIFDV